MKSTKSKLTLNLISKSGFKLKSSLAVTHGLFELLSTWGKFDAAITVLVTGGAGFVGHHFIRRLLKHPEFKIISLDRLDFSGNLNRLSELKEEFGATELRRLDVIFHDLKAEINNQLAKQIGEVDFIVHMAAGSHVNRSIENPLQFVQDNVVGTCNLLEFARFYQPNLKKFIYFGTDEVFGSAPENIQYAEWDRYNSRSPYSATKAGAEELCVAYENTYKMPVYCTHTMNVFGERQLPEKFIGLHEKTSRSRSSDYPLRRE